MLGSLINMLVLRNETGLSCLEQLGDLLTSIPQPGKFFFFHIDYGTLIDIKVLDNS